MSVICLYPQFFAYRHVYDLHSIHKYQQNEHFRLASIQCKHTHKKKNRLMLTKSCSRLWKGNICVYWSMGYHNYLYFVLQYKQNQQLSVVNMQKGLLIGGNYFSGLGKKIYGVIPVNKAIIQIKYIL